jgi:hypothetical protein
VRAHTHSPVGAYRLVVGFLAKSPSPSLTEDRVPTIAGSNAFNAVRANEGPMSIAMEMVGEAARKCIQVLGASC